MCLFRQCTSKRAILKLRVREEGKDWGARRMPATLGEILPAAAARHLERTALVVDDERLSFSELDFLSNRIGNGLVAIGVQPGDRAG
jgi:non-ribosomal peptide synthetase component E (peptide arylation enzyme)